MFSEKDIAIVILNWNGKSLLQEFLPSVVSNSKNASIYLADNASSDNSVAYIQENFPSVKIIKNQANYGYAKGYNKALQNLKEKIFCLLNNDVQVTKNWLVPILETFNNHKKTVIIQPKILDYKNKNFFEYAGAAGGYIDALAYPYCRGRLFNKLEEDKGQYNQLAEIFWASGACFFIKRKAFEILGGFDEVFFAHMEEIDLCWRAYNIDLQVRYVPNSSVYHLGGGTLQNTNPQKTYLNFRNSLYSLVKNAYKPIFIKVLFRLIIDGIIGIRFLILLKPQHTIAILKAHGHFYYKLAYYLKIRKKTPKKNNYYNKLSLFQLYFLKKG